LDPDIPDIWQIPRKFDGHATRQLTSPELRQLAGRAGRYGLTSLGVAACCQGGENVEVTSFLGKKYSHVGYKLIILINHPQFHPFFIGGRNHSQIGGLLLL
jgi:hypothetical protein